MAYFNFDNLIKRYSTEFTAIVPAVGSYNDAGDYVDGNDIEVTLTGAIISMRESRILRSEGAYTAQDRALYMSQELPNALKKARIIHNGKEYRIESELTNNEFTGVWSYVLKYCSIFKVGE